MPEAFICYSSKDTIFADLLRMKLKEGGIGVWVDEGSIRAGDEWRDAIDRGIRSADVCLVVITPASCASPYVTYEWGFALGRGVRVIPLLLETAELHPRLVVLQHLDFRDMKKAPWKKLLDEVCASAPVGEVGDGPSRVGDMTVDQLHEMIEGAVALASASAKDVGSAPADAISRSTRSVVEAAAHYSRIAEPSADEEPSRSILWVDDRPNNNVHERTAFESMGWRFTLAESTNEALEILERESFSAIISDMGRREGPREGYALLEVLRSRGDETPFFIYAGSNAPEHKAEAVRRGAQGSTNMPQELFDLVTQALS